MFSVRLSSAALSFLQSSLRYQISSCYPIVHPEFLYY